MLIDGLLPQSYAYLCDNLNFPKFVSSTFCSTKRKNKKIKREKL